MARSPSESNPAAFVSVADVADELAVTQRFVRRLIADGELPAVKIGTRLVRVRRADLDGILRPVAALSPNAVR
ncbi:hypothetical protein Cch01nite_40570 [Cellulomonas chitinilytica]|uniref:Helix-turn-helix domain-containing protein n=1 Tax=Cellulomonas chitinilytica TaxID=398759 RepID=A0A919U1N0_9CELL|nr:helix-turn-helix domain-containing protein [Cellulomonas chitinilytica]GIG23333.1 hypothetical protein Cch01nite_40570 [Cellulomonas chitinilytica]